MCALEIEIAIENEIEIEIEIEIVIEIVIETEIEIVIGIEIEITSTTILTTASTGGTEIALMAEGDGILNCTTALKNCGIGRKYRKRN